MAEREEEGHTALNQHRVRSYVARGFCGTSHGEDANAWLQQCGNCVSTSALALINVTIRNFNSYIAKTRSFR